MEDLFVALFNAGPDAEVSSPPWPPHPITLQYNQHGIVTFYRGVIL